MREPVTSSILVESIRPKDLMSGGQVPEAIPAGSTLIYKCRGKNYNLVGKRTRTCGSNGTYSSERPPKCERKCWARSMLLK